jgi:hypothetical protein
MKEIKCDKCKKCYPVKDVHSILGVWVCVYCYPEGKDYCDCCSNDECFIENVNKKCEDDDNVNSKLF